MVRVHPAPFDSAVFFLQNREGALKWPTSGDLVEGLLQAFAKVEVDGALAKSKIAKGVYIPKNRR